MPAVFAEGGTPDKAFVADIYEHVSFLGDLHQQMSSQNTAPESSSKNNSPKTFLARSDIDDEQSHRQSERRRSISRPST